MSCSLSHGEAGPERGFADTKRIVMGRLSLSYRSVQTFKVKDGLRLRSSHLKMHEEREEKIKRTEEENETVGSSICF